MNISANAPSVSTNHHVQSQPAATAKAAEPTQEAQAVTTHSDGHHVPAAPVGNSGHMINTTA